MSERVVYLTDEQWRKIGPFAPRKSRSKKDGRPRADDRSVFEVILWILKTGTRWRDLPERYPHPSARWQPSREWYEDDVLKDRWRAFLSELDRDGILHWDKVFLNAAAFSARKGARQSRRPSREEERSAWYWSMARVFVSEHAPTLPRRLRLHSLVRRLERYESPSEPREDHGHDPSD